MMYPRLSILKNFLTEDGVIFASIDEVESASLRLLLDEIFGTTNRLGTIVWKNATDNNPTNIAIEHEYILAYAKNKQRLPREWKSKNLAVKDKLLEIGENFNKKYPNAQKRQEEYSKWFRQNKSQLWPFQDYKFIDEGGIYTGMRSVHNPGKEGYRYDVIHPATSKPCTQPMMGYRFPKSTMDELISNNRVIFGIDESKLVELKVYVKDYRVKLASVFELDGRIGTNEIKQIFPDDNRPFDFPKPTELLEELLSFTTSQNDLILDSYAGSGTTGHAVLKLNKADQQNRRFILVEMKSSISKTITTKRVLRVVEGYKKSKGEHVEGLGGGFRYCELGEPLFDEAGNIRKKVSFSDLARHVYFTETGEPLPKERVPQSPFIGTCRGVGIYLLYNGVLHDKKANGGNVLTRTILASLPRFEGPKVIYCTGCLLGQERLQAENIIVRQIPYEIKVS